VYRSKAIGTINNNGWQEARKRAGLQQVRVHDLKHTFGRRLRAAGVSFEDRQDLLGHRSGRITTHYSAAELASNHPATTYIGSKEVSIESLRATCEMSLSDFPLSQILSSRLGAFVAQVKMS